MNPTRKPKPIVCECPECAGRVWTIDEVREAARVAGRDGEVVNGMTLPGIGRAVGHPLTYRPTPVAGAWRKRTPADAVARDGGRLPRVPACRSRLMPVNGARIGAADGPGAETAL